jgi:type III secretion protein D
MKQLRILTGVHAGAQLALKRQQSRVGSDDDADVQITDWSDAPLTIVVEGEGAGEQLSLLQQEDGAPARRVGVLDDFVPRRFGDVVLCAGPAQAGWPSDVELMRTWMRGSGRSARVLRSSSKATWGAALGAVVMLLGGLAAVVSGQSATSASPPPPSALERVQHALGAAGVVGLHAKQVDRRVVVEGLLPDSAQVARARAALLPFGENVLLHRYAAATDVSRQISDALHSATVSVVHAGNGVFKVQGQTDDVPGLREDVARIAADVGPLVARIDVEVQEALPVGRVRLGAMWHGDGLQYVQTADGTKHLSLQTPTEDGTAPPDGSLPSSTPTPDGEPHDQPPRADGVR